MADITHGTWIKDGKAVDSVYQSGVKAYGRNLLTGTTDQPQTATGTEFLINTVGTFVPVKGQQYTAQVRIVQKDNPVNIQEWNMSGNERVSLIASTTAEGFVSTTFMAPDADNYDSIAIQLAWANETDKGSYTWSEGKVENGTIATPWTPAPEDVLN